MSRGDLTLDPSAFPPGFLFGCASAAHQVEGGLDNDWTRFEREPGRIVDGSVSGAACDFRNRFRGDLAELAARGQTAHRFSMEWSRVEPREGEFDAAALRWYGEVVDTCRAHGLEPFVTLLHFTLPVWLAERGGLLAEDAPLRFARFAAACAEHLGDRVRWWTTINEPAVHASMGYLLGEFPPGHTSLGEAFAALRTLVRMHAAATLAIRAVSRRHRRGALVGIAHHERRLRALRPRNPLDRAAAALPDRMLNRWFLDCCTTGRLLRPAGRGEPVIGLAGSMDYLGVNYYCEERVAFDPGAVQRLFARNLVEPGLPTSTFGWAIDPPGLHRALVDLAERYRLPLAVLENGVADEHDELRPQFIRDHLAQVQRAIADGVDVRAYLHWTALDNFEWAQGYSQRFGLFSVDRETLERRAKPSADVYAEICAAHAAAYRGAVA